MTSKNSPVIVLGKTFNSEEERRTYFREELRKKLPELKKMEGFPIGEDEDILNLSDPPYYTACPNPWLNDFIAEWEAEKKELEKQGLRKAHFEVTEPYAADVSEGKKNPIYTAHTYPTKVPHPAIMRYILKYTQPGDIVYDGFAGTGMTGVAAQSCSKPDQKLKLKIESEQNVVWGSRKSILSDLSPIASFIAYNFNNNYDAIKFREESKEIKRLLEQKFGWMYTTSHSDHKSKGRINYTVWSDVFECRQCSQEMAFWDVMIDHANNVPLDEFSCPSCSTKHNKKNLIKVWESYFDDGIGKVVKTIKKHPVLIHYKVGKKTFLKAPDKEDFETLGKIKTLEINNNFPTFRIHKGDKTSEPTRLGIEYSHQFFTKRALACLTFVYEHCNSQNLILLTSMLNRSSLLVKTLVSNYLSQQLGKTVGGWAGTPLDGTLYIPSINSEVSIIESLESRLNSLLKMMDYKSKFNSHSNFLTQIDSATEVSIKSNSIDYIFTDPPFGSNRIYSDLNFLNESWIKVRTNNKLEAIESRAQNKSIFTYQNLMRKSFSEFYRVLKPGKWMTVEFSNTSAAVWNGIQTSIQQSGFVIANVAALDKKQGSFNAVNNATSVKQDLVISCYKPSSEFDQRFNQHKHSDVGVWEFVAEHLEHLPIHLVSGNSTTAIIERSPKILFDRLIAFYVQRGLPVPIDAGKFQQGLREQFIERDGMFFTNEQVQEYDRKKAEVPNFTQLSIFVANEQDAIYWLRNILEKEPKTEQDLHPLWMKEVAGNMRKGDTLPEMRTILEENFLKNEKGQWYLPDPENEADLEKLRTKRLLKQFETYKTEAYKPKGKIKEARVEALRAGYKQCYQDKDFKTIVQVGDRIPNNLLMEDEVLLQFYDIASSKV
jgi:DNA modification methylase